MLGSDSRDSRPWLNYVAAPRLDFRPAMTLTPVIFNSVESQRLSPAQQKCQISSTQIHAEKPRFSSAQGRGGGASVSSHRIPLPNLLPIEGVGIHCASPPQKTDAARQKWIKPRGLRRNSGGPAVPAGRLGRE